MKTLLPLAIALVLGLHGAIAQITESKIRANDNEGGDYFGNSVSIEGDHALVGAYEAANGGPGSAYIFGYNGTTWIEEAKLSASDGDAEDLFGQSVALSGNYALIGAHEDDDNGLESGAAYVFHYDGSSWLEEVKLTASDAEAGDYFGRAVALSSEYLLIGARGDNGFTGSAYIFRYTGAAWVEEAKLTASDGAVGDYFGTSVSLSGSYALIGTSEDDDNGSGSGSAYVFHFDGSGWVEEAKLTASDGEEFEHFGYSVSLSGDRALIGAYGDRQNGIGLVGAAYIFRREGPTWVEEAKVTDGTGVGYHRFGWSVSLFGEYALIGSYSDEDLGPSSGSAYIFRYDGMSWAEEVKLLASDGTEYDFFGWAVSLSTDHAIVGAIGDGNGSAYVYSGFAAPEPAVPCDSINLFQARCISGGTLQARAVLLNSTEYAGEEVIMDVDGVEHPLTIITNGIHSKAQLQLTGQTSGDHIVQLVNPGACFNPLTVSCPSTGTLTNGDIAWDEERWSVSFLQGEPPSTTRLDGNYPNPFNPSTTIRYELGESAQVTLKVFNTLGEEVATLVGEFQDAGYKSATWNGRNTSGSPVASGIYIYRLTAGNVVLSEKMLFIK
jgi:hypothetical protein